MGDNKNSIIKIKGKLTFEDVKYFSKINYFIVIRITKILTVITGILGIPVGLIFIFDIILDRPVREDIHLAELLGAAVLVIILIKLIMWISPKLIVWGYKILYEEFETTISTAAFIQESESSTTKLTWDKLYKVIFAKEHILFYISATMAFIVPKRFISKEQLKIIVDIIKISMPEKRIIKRII